LRGWEGRQECGEREKGGDGEVHPHQEILDPPLKPIAI